MDNILILTPVKDAMQWLPGYFKNLQGLNYPHEHISIGILEGDSEDGSYNYIQERAQELDKLFRSVKAVKKDFAFTIPKGVPRWSSQLQIQRRSILAKSRNHLLFHALRDEDWVLWLDVDVVEYPKDIIQLLFETGKEIVHPNCIQEYGGKAFDLNAWKDKGKLHMHDLRGGEDLVELDSVGGTMILVSADRHRDGLIFPPYLYGKRNQRIRKHNTFGRRKDLLDPGKALQAWNRREWQGEIETEGFAMMAHDMGIGVWGMPNLEIRHRI